MHDEARQINVLQTLELYYLRETLDLKIYNTNMHQIMLQKGDHSILRSGWLIASIFITVTSNQETRKPKELIFFCSLLSNPV